MTNTILSRIPLLEARPCVSARALVSTLLLGLALSARPASADVLWEWNDAALAATVEARQPPFVATRAMAILDVAMFDAVNAVERRYAPYALRETAAPGASADAAAASAAHTVLAALFPGRSEAWDALLRRSLARVGDVAARAQGVRLGNRAGATVLALRAQDGAEAPGAYRPVTQAGRYVPTALPAGSSWASVRPWVLTSCEQFRPPAPPALDSPIWRRDYDEISAVGGKASASRTASQTEAARFWTMTGPAAQWPVARALSAAPGRTLLQNARFLALMAMAVADAYVAVFDAKYHYQLWRPITAVRNGGGMRDPLSGEASWEPLVETPMHPEYPCAHCITSGAAAAVLEAEFGADRTATPIEMTSATAPGVRHRWTTVREWQEEVSNARIWGGIHYRNSAEVGTAMGRRIGEWTIARRLEPLARREGRRGASSR
jgi:hypothetical protein